MSGYLEVKYPFKSNLGLNPFKSWKRQWCILRPSPLSAGGGSLAVYCSEAGSPAGTVELRTGCIVKRAKSRTRPYAFAVFSIEEPCKPRILLAAQSLQEAQQWMDKIRDLLNGDKLLGTESLLKDSYSVTVIPTELSRKCVISGDNNVTLSSTGLMVSRPQTAGVVIRWQHITDVLQTREHGDKGKICVLSIDSGFSGGGELKFSSGGVADRAGELAGAVRAALRERAGRAPLSRSQPDLSACHHDGELRRSSWYSGPSEVSLDDTDLIMSKEAQCIPSGQLSRSRARRLLRASLADLAHLAHLTGDDGSAVDRRSLVSISSGVYEEITEEAAPREEHTYESVADCVYATWRRTGKRHPPPLPPRTPFLAKPWSRDGVTRHSSLGELHHKPARPAKPFSVFRKRLKSDSRVSSPKCETKDKDVETKKKKFDFTPTRDIFKSFKVSRKMKNLKITGLSKGETKSCEFLDETQHVSSNRCSKSVECLEGNDSFDEFDGSLPLVPDEAVQEIVQLILGTPDISKVRLKDGQCEGDYMPMSPIVPPIEHHYVVMSPPTNIA